MKGSKLNSIQSAVLNLKYESKVAAVRSNVLIESIFNSHILPDLDKVISKNIPEGALLKLSKLEIDIGTINEKELKNKLADRIVTALEEALHIATKTSGDYNTSILTTSGSNGNDFILEALEFYFLNGYFPTWIDSMNTMGDLLTIALQEEKIYLLEMLFRIGKNESVTKRIAYGLSPKLFDELIYSLNPINGHWIIDFNKTILNSKKKSGLTLLINKEFAQKLNFFALQNILNNKSNTFDREKFSDRIIQALAVLLKSNLHVLLQTAHLIDSKSQVIDILKVSIAKLADKSRSLPNRATDSDNQLEELIQLLNTETTEGSPLYLKNQILKILEIQKTKEILYGELTEHGVIELLKLSFPNRSGLLLKLMKSFINLVSKGKETISIKMLVKATVSYLNESAVREFNEEEYVLYLLHTADFNVQKTLTTTGFKSFMREQKQVDLNKFDSLLQKERVFPEVSSLGEILSKSRKEWSHSINREAPKEDNTKQYFLIYNRKIVWHYLISGGLPEAYGDLTRDNVKTLLNGLIQQKDRFLMSQLQQHKNLQKLADRLEVLYASDILHQSGDMTLLVLLSETKETNTYLSQLFSLSDLGWSGKFDLKFWKATVLHFALHSFVEGRKYASGQFGLAFMNHLQHELKNVNASESFNDIINRVASQGDKNLKQMVEHWKAGLRKETYSNEDFSKSPSSNLTLKTKAENIEQYIIYHISILRFYQHRKFFPWWSEKIDLSDVLTELEKAKKTDLKRFSRIIVQLDGEEPFLERLLGQLPKVHRDQLTLLLQEINSFDQITETFLLRQEENANFISNEVEVHKSRQDQKKIVDANDLFQALYEFDDAAILERWWVNSSNIAKQIANYTLLAPQFYFRNLSPIRWRKIVYEFALAYYDKSMPKVSMQFDREFLKHLKKKHAHIDWEAVLVSVYRMNQTSEGKQLEFPVGMAKLLKHELSSINHGAHEALTMNAENKLDLDTPIKVENAGLIVFWPFLIRFFEQLSLLQDGVFLDEKCRIQAVYLLQYLACNAIDFPEHQLVINKILVGMLPHEIVLPMPILSREAKNMAESLINGLINNWEKVKDSTPEAIQETFLQRDGILITKEDKMVLRIDKKGVDVLLTSIPWNITWVKLSWMKLPLYVEWV